MRPNLPRGKTPAPGILYAPERQPAKFVTGLDGKLQKVSDPRGYFLGQHNSDKPPSRRDKHRANVAARRAQLQTRPNFEAQIRAEEKAARGRKARGRKARSAAK